MRAHQQTPRSFLKVYHGGIRIERIGGLTGTVVFCPETRGVVHFFFREQRFEAVDQAFVGIYAHPELLTITNSFKAGFYPERK